MHRIDTPNRSLDLFGPGKDGFRDGNKTAGTNATEFTAAWCNDQQENVAQVIEGAGFALVKGDGTQLRQAITKMIQSAQRAVIIDAASFSGAVVGLGKAVYWDAANNRFDLAVADGSAKQSVVGFADVPNAKVYCFGSAVLFAGLTLGARYYLDGATAGAITAVKPSNNIVYVGLAKGATELVVDIDESPASLSSSGIQGAFRNLTGVATGLNGLATYALDELTTGDGAGNFQTLRNWAGSINVATLGTNGIDVGAVSASTWYYAYGISKPDGTKAFIASLSASGPSFTNAAGYTKWARIGSFRTDGTGNKYPLRFVQDGREHQWAPVSGTNLTSLPMLASGVAGIHSSSTPTWASVSTANGVPPTASDISIVLSNGSGNRCIAAPNNSYGGSASTNPAPIQADTGTSLVNNGKMLFETVSTIYWASNAAACFMQALGWTDNL